jgi:hypothetical protein
MILKCRHARKPAEAVLMPANLWLRKPVLNDGFWIAETGYLHRNFHFWDLTIRS